jgi:hypothetical protein
MLSRCNIHWFAPLVYQNSQAEAHSGDSLRQASMFFPLSGNIKCEINSQSRPIDMSIFVSDEETVIGNIIFQSKTPTRSETRWDAESFDLEPNGGATRALIKASLISSDNFVRSCIGSNDPQLTAVGDIRGNCVDFLDHPRSTFKIETRAGSVL